MVVKPSELTPLSGAWVADVFAEAGAPDGLVGVVQGGGETGEALVERARGREGLIFTGSAATGRKIAAAAGAAAPPGHARARRARIRCSCSTTRTSNAPSRVRAWGSFANCGQVCVGIERIYVSRSLHARFVDALAGRARALRIGRGEDPDVDLGPLITEQHRSKVEDLVAEALERGAEAVTGARRPDVGLPGWFYEPTVLVGGDPEARIEREEVFGPVVTVQLFDDEDEAVALANGVELRARREHVDARRLPRPSACLAHRSGNGVDERPRLLVRRRPCAVGRPQGVRARADALEARALRRLARQARRLGRGRVAVPWWYPYGSRALDGFQGVLEVLHGDRKLRGVVDTPSRPRAPRAPLPAPMTELSHVSSSGDVRMVDVGAKPLSRRRAVASGRRAHGAGDGAAPA